jgi:hypothetical protein
VLAGALCYRHPLHHAPLLEKKVAVKKKAMVKDTKKAKNVRKTIKKVTKVKKNRKACRKVTENLLLLRLI